MLGHKAFMHERYTPCNTWYMYTCIYIFWFLHAHLHVPIGKHSATWPASPNWFAPHIPNKKFNKIQRVVQEEMGLPRNLSKLFIWNINILISRFLLQLQVINQHCTSKSNTKVIKNTDIKKRKPHIMIGDCEFSPEALSGVLLWKSSPKMEIYIQLQACLRKSFLKSWPPGEGYSTGIYKI